MRIQLDPDICFGGGFCILAAPQIFEQDQDDGIAVVLHDQPRAAQESAVREAVLGCPSGALSIVENA